MMTAPDSVPAGYRPCVGIMLINEARHIFVGERLDTPGAWQMPQGGIDDGETPEQAATRELLEETGISSARLIATGKDWQTYELPQALSRKAWGGRYRGQAQIWTLFAFTGSDEEIELETGHPEFSRWKWSPPDRLIEEIVAFKRDVYAATLAEFGSFLSR